jgi:histidine phosphotransferase ChpT
MHSHLRVGELLTAHLCHELASPITAMLLAENAADLACLRRAAGRLQFYHFAYGFDRRNGVAGIPPHELVARLFADSRITCDYAQPVRRLLPDWQKLACNLLAIAADCLPYGGCLTVTAAPLRVEASGAGARVAEELYTALLRRPRITRITVNNVHAYFTGRLAEALGFRLEVISAGDMISFGVFENMRSDRRR